ncbi:unnamed protein product [marine sediment metagenome]|uniref:Macrocin O-methyltransferase n=1 Tax=marine sediment metagenome TaxID=412755 RepID=X0XSC2_9ZZZZ
MGNMQRKIIKLLWNWNRDYLLGLKGFADNTIRYDDAFLDLFMEIYSQQRALLDIRGMYNIYRLVKKLINIEGDIAEVGVYKGGSARVICEVKGGKSLHLFDSFEGMPETNETIDKYKKGELGNTTLENVKNYLSKFKNVYFYKGYFPESARELTNRGCKFSFVNLDVDIYESTLNGLKFFYPKMNAGG